MLSSLNLLLAILTLSSHIFLVVYFLYFLLSKGSPEHSITKFLAKNGLYFAFAVSAMSSATSLFYSVIVGYEPCDLCWYQRIFMFPQVFILGIALYKKSNAIIDYALTLSAIGGLIALYHNYIYFAGSSSIFPCPASVSSAPCAVQYVLEFGYITIPVMSLTSFILISFFLLLKKYQRQ